MYILSSFFPSDIWQVRIDEYIQYNNSIPSLLAQGRDPPTFHGMGHYPRWSSTLVMLEMSGNKFEHFSRFETNIISNQSSLEDRDLASVMKV